jgi:hypothetical protein
MEGIVAVNDILSSWCCVSWKRKFPTNLFKNTHSDRHIIMAGPLNFPHSLLTKKSKRNHAHGLGRDVGGEKLEEGKGQGLS